MNKKQLWNAFAQAVMETPAGFFRPAVAALTTAFEPVNKPQTCKHQTVPVRGTCHRRKRARK